MGETGALEPDDMERRVYHLKLAGYSFHDIAAELRITSAFAVACYRKHVMYAAKTFGGEDRQMIVQTELDRLETLQQPHWSLAAQGDPKSTELVLKIMAHRMKLLGLDQMSATDKQDIARVLIVGGSQQEFIDALNAGRTQQALAGPSPEDGDDLRRD